MTRFEVGKVYAHRWICNWDSTSTYKVMKRTEKSIWLRNEAGKIKMRRVRVVDGVEECDPTGRYSMSPILTAK